MWNYISNMAGKQMNILFVDDEKMIREGMKSLLDWEKLGCEQFYIAGSAAEGMEILQQYFIDLVISDIYMKKFTGIEFAKQIKQYFPQVKIILLSAHENFEYAREAIEAGVLKYLLKPVSAEELEETILSVKKQITEEATAFSKRQESEKMVHLYQPILEHELWKALLRGELRSAEEVNQRLKLTGIKKPPGSLFCLVTAVMTGEKQTVMEAIKEAVVKQFHKVIFNYCCLKPYGYVFILKEHVEAAEQMELKTQLEHQLGVRLCLCQGKGAAKVEQLHESYKDCCNKVELYESISQEYREGTEDGDHLAAAAKKLIKEQYQDDNLSVNSIAGHLHVSPSYLSRVFKKKNKITCIEYITNTRIERAKQLLRETSLKHHQIAQEAGYTNVYYFSAQFKKITGVTPGQYRKRVGRLDV